MTTISPGQTCLDRPDTQDYLKPSFFTAALWAGLLSLIALPIGFGGVEARTAFSPADWYAHEGLFGYLGAIVTGFCLDATPRQAGRPPLAGRLMGILMLAWLAGRLAMLASGTITAVVAGGVDSVFLVLAAVIAMRAALADRRILPQAGVLVAMAAGNVVFHLGLPEFGTRIGTAAVIMLVTLVSGRPSGRETAPAAGFDLVDIATLATSAVALFAWIVLPTTLVTGILLLLGGVAQAVRLVGWVRAGVGQGTLNLVQQLAYGLVPLGFLALGMAAFGHEAPGPANIRAWLVAAVGILTMAMMLRADLGAAERSAGVRLAAYVIDAAVAAAFVLRLFTGWVPSLALVAGAAWVVAFVVFVLGYLPLLARSRAAAA